MNTRDDRLDSAKGILITLVVLGHWLEAANYWEDDLIRNLLTSIYAFHMPAFIFLAGITSKAENLGRRIAVLISLLVIFQCLYFLYLPLMDSNKQFDWMDPFWMLWFLLGMLWWLLAIAMARFSPRLALLISLPIGLGSGAISAVEYVPALDRALCFLPWFMAGYVIGQPAFDKAAQTSRALTITLATASLLLAGLLGYLEVGSGWLYGSNGFAVLDVSVSYGVLMRSLLLLVATIMTWTLIACSSAAKGIFVKAGRRSLGIYLLHGFFILPATPWLGVMFDRHGSLITSLICVTGTMLVIHILSIPVFDRHLRTLGSRCASLLLRSLQSIRDTVHSV